MAARRLKILAIEDSEVDAAILERQLAKADGLSVELLHCDDPEEALAWLSDAAIDLVFLDYNLGETDGLELLQRIRGAGDERPVVMLTGQGDEYVAARSIRAGADEYIVKGDIEPQALARVIASAEAERRRSRGSRALQGNIERLTRENEELRSVALFDQLTGLATRRLFEERLGEEIARSRRSGSPLALLMLDIDHFKQINDRWGHATGDRALAQMGALLKDTLRRSDLAARLGGDELCVLASGQDQEGARVLAERVLEVVAKTPVVASDGCEVPLSCSIGVAAFDPGRDDEETLLARGDAALYDAKRAGRNRVAVSGQSDRSFRR